MHSDKAKIIDLACSRAPSIISCFGIFKRRTLPLYLRNWRHNTSTVAQKTFSLLPHLTTLLLGCCDAAGESQAWLQQSQAKHCKQSCSWIQPSKWIGQWNSWTSWASRGQVKTLSAGVCNVEYAFKSFSCLEIEPTLYDVPCFASWLCLAYGKSTCWRHYDVDRSSLLHVLSLPMSISATSWYAAVWQGWLLRKKPCVALHGTNLLELKYVSIYIYICIH